MKRYSVLLLLLLLLSWNLCAKDVLKPEPRFETIKAIHLLGIQFERAMETQTMDGIWKTWSEVRSDLPKPIGKEEYGVFYYGEDFDPETETGYYYMVGKQIEPQGKTPDGWVQHTIPGGLYGVFDYRGSLDDKERAYNYIYGDWIPQNKAVPLMQDMFERYINEYQVGVDEVHLEIWIPLEYQPTENK